MEDQLTLELLSKCVSHLGRSDNGLQYLYHHLSLPNSNLSDVSLLGNYVHLQKLEVPHNHIADVSFVRHMPRLLIMDVSHNHIEDISGFEPPIDLKEVNMSFNRLSNMDFSSYNSVSKLELDNNGFTEVKGLDRCFKLTHLSLANNMITSISGLDTLPLKHLNLRGNQLETMDGLENLTKLRILDLSHNRITSLIGFRNLQLLGVINVENNLIPRIEECKHIAHLFLLVELNMLQNPVKEVQDYRLSIIFLLQRLTMLDKEEVTAEEKVEAINRYDPPLEVMAARDHRSHLVYQLLQPQVLHDSTLPSLDLPYPMLVLSGPRACGKRELAHRLCQEFHQYFAYGTSHTTRGRYLGEEDGSDYHFVSQEDFVDLVHMGKMIQSMKFGGDMFGLSTEAVDALARDGLACCVPMELEGVLSLKNCHFEPRYVLLLPSRVDQYVERLRSRGIYTPAQVDAAVSRLHLYVTFHQQRPGFFDSTVVCDDLDEAYQTLQRLVKDYLLLEDQDDGEKRPTEASSSDAVPAQAEPSAVSAPTKPLDLLDLSYRTYASRIQAQLTPQKSALELASIRRREQLVRQAIEGKSPRVFTHLIKRSAHSEASQFQLPDPTTVYGDSSSDESHISPLPPRSGPAGPPGPSEPAVSGGHVKDGAGEPEVGAEGRPGRGAKPILPPIPPGRRTPAGPSPGPSPRT
ncbi:leucine-rich repeat and guanylate kinase domain-containing protein isoform X2 [Synchiropus splendidus]|uniref:leucine-rich repeat and guanylate kinase domain-containing protein isoform X2 n=1 Tax=Synchiropus splendidus TaxID=270530 RepID=UPI00237E8293|nr:leucine-rich repeat and guanylate kinase domain-containing protein isoform X2 [Synchiropus splendidus]